jgi:arginyl-tRNA synthetase
MSSVELEGLQKLLQHLSVAWQPADAHDISVLTNPIELWRSSLVTLLVDLVKCQTTDAYKSVQWPNNISNGDLSVTLPRLSPGGKVAEIASVLVDRVRAPCETASHIFLKRLTLE